MSVHATDPEVRRTMMGNPSAIRIMERLTALKDAGIQFHCQIVLCPQLNDKAVLERSISDLYSLCPAAQSLAVVPVGLTKFRDKLYKLRCLTKQEAGEAIDMIEQWQKKALAEHGTAFVFASDELYIIAERELPDANAYEDYCQIENGVGLLRKFEEEFLYALQDKQPLKSHVTLDSASGVSAAPFMQKLFERLLPYGIRINVHPIVNHYFGETVTVSGLITAGDLAEQLKDTLTSDTLLIPHNMMRERDDVFLDGIRLPQLEEKLGAKIAPIWATDGEVFINELFDMLG